VAGHRGYWVVYDHPGGMGRVAHHSGDKDCEDILALLQQAENNAADQEGRAPRTVRVWPVEARDFTAQRPRGGT